MAEARKFLFDTSFDEPTGGRAGAIQQARAEAYEEGRNAGRAEAAAAAEQAAAGAMQAIAAKLDELESSREAVEGVLAAHAARAATAMVGKVVPGLVRRSGVDEVETLMRGCVERLLEEPRIVVRVAEADLDPLQDRIAQIKAESGYAGEVVLLSDPALGPGDCRIEWADGGVERDAEAIWKDIESAVDRWLADR